MQDNLKIDSHKLNHHPGRVASWMIGENIFPLYVEIATTSACNHRCIFCALDFMDHKEHLLATQTLCDSLAEMGKNGVKAVMFSGEGEPTLHKDLSLFVKCAKKAGLDVALTTNGIPFTKKLAEQCLPHLSWVKFSVDAGTPETYANIHKTKPEDFQKLIANIKDAAGIKKKNKYSVKIGVQLLLLEENAHETITLAKKVKELGADYIVVKPYSRHPGSINKCRINYEKIKYIQARLKKIQSDKFGVILRAGAIEGLKNPKPYPECYALPFFALIDAQGNLLPCNLFYGKEEYYYGNLYKNTFSEILSSKKREEVLKKIYKKGTASCREICRLDQINRYLYDLKHPPDHVNFI